MLLFIIIVIVFSLVMLYIEKKNCNTCGQQTRIAEAIFNYQIDCIHEGVKPRVDYDDMENYEITLFRFWDWSYEHILSKEKFELVKPYIKEN